MFVKENPDRKKKKEEKRCLINVNKICGVLRNGRKTTKWVIYGRP